ncbi:hypothetical protein [Streptosporangium sp. NPDC049376]|uniref:hypothetical protein n=1 Tax=Streptosporangium sp. NPDC049376 TaxID=3366192 RepID=UPI003789454B
MKRLSVVVALGVFAALLTDTGTALAAPPVEPVQALRKQFVAGRGVLVSETSRTTVKASKETYTSRTTGTIAFGKPGVVGYDLTEKVKITPKNRATLSADELETMRTPLRAVNVGRYTYVQGFEWGPMPEGTSWIRFGKSATWQWYGQRGEQRVDVLSPARLKFVISKATSFHSGEYRGTLRTEDLYAERGPMNPEKLKISFRLFVDRNGIPVRLVTRYAETEQEFRPKGKTVTRTYDSVVDTRYHHWNAKVKVVAPPEAEVVDFGDLPINQSRWGEESLKLNSAGPLEKCANLVPCRRPFRIPN